MARYSCKRCGNRTFYTIRRGKRRCKRCHYEFSIGRRIGGLKLTKRDWQKPILGKNHMGLD